MGHHVVRHAACEQAHSFISLRLDGELSELERALLEAHLDGCVACRDYGRAVEAATAALRAAPLERLEHRIVLPPVRRRVSLRQLQAAAAAATAAAAAVFGVVVGIDAALPEDARVEVTAATYEEPVSPQRELQLRLRATRPDGRRGDEIAV